jgi:CRISPR-associated protein Cas1
MVTERCRRTGVRRVSADWRVIDLTGHSGAIETRRGRLVVNDTEIPLDDVTCILTGLQTRWHGGITALAAKFEVPIVACDWRGVPTSVLLPWSSNSRVATRHHAQAALSLPRKKNAWMRIVRAKISGQASNLTEPSTAAAKLKAYARDVRSGDPANIEARAARTYWSSVFTGEAFTRDADAPGRNELLNYGYAVLRGVVIREIVAAGLTPTLGIWHRNRANRFGLADDLIEPFRPAVDHVVRQFSASARVADREVKEALVGTLGLPLAESGHTVQTGITSLARAFALYVEGNASALTVPIWNPPRG